MSESQQTPQPTVAVGVGRTGIEVLDSLARLVDNQGENEHYHFIAIDSDRTDLEEKAPDAATVLHLGIADDVVNLDQTRYPYLTDDMDIVPVGTRRQRPVGRYKLDSNGTPGFTDYFHSLYDQIRSHVAELELSLDAEAAESVNIYLVHSFGGGTGSGTFPLLNTMLNTIGNALESRYDIDVHQVGVGVVPDPTFKHQAEIPPRGAEIYYPNSYASFEDLRQMIETADGEPIELPVYSVEFSASREREQSEIGELLGSTNGFELNTPPFDTYYLMGVDEGRIDSPGGGGPYEQYAEMLDNAVAEGLYTHSLCVDLKHGPFVQLGSFTGTIGQAEVRVPERRLRQYCMKKRERNELEHRLTEEIPGEITAEQERLENVQAVRKRPAQTEAILDESIEEHVAEEFGTRFGAGRDILRDTTATELREVLNAVENRYDNGLLALPLALAYLDERVENIAHTVEKERAEVVSEMWIDHDMIENHTVGDPDPGETTVSEKADALENYLQRQIEHHEEQVETTDPGGFISNLIGSTELEKLQDRLKYYQSDYDELMSLREDHAKVRSLREALREERQSVNRRFDERESDLRSNINDLREDRRTVERNLEETRRYLRSLRDELATGGLGERLGYLPLKNIDAIDLQMLENELTDLPSFIDRGIIDEEIFESAIEELLEHADARENTILSRGFDSTVTNHSPELFGLFVLHHESLADSEYAEYLPNPKSIGAKARRRLVPHINDPYRVSLLTFLHRGPIEALTTYQRLEEAAESGEFDQTLTGIDYRRSFAYPEWYGRDIREAFDLQDSAE